MEKRILAHTVAGTIPAPASKSYLQRAVALAAMCEGTTRISGYSPCEDSQAAIQVARDLGARIQLEGDVLTIQGCFPIRPQARIHIGEAGLATRMFSPIVALSDSEVEVTGCGSILDRPQGLVVDALEQLGVHVTTAEGRLPLTIRGPIRSGEISVDGSMSSQLLTGLLMALPLADGNSTIHVRDLKSKPYVDMTLSILRQFAVGIEREGYETFHIHGGQRPQACDYVCEGDWSGAAFPLVAAAIAGEVSVTGLKPDSLQADKGILNAIRKAGALVDVSEKEVTVRMKELKGFLFDATECPDLFPPLVVLALAAHGESRIAGVHRLRHKESDRAKALVEEFAKLGGKLSVEGDELVVQHSALHAGTVHSHHDHRIAMAAAVAALIADGEVVIEGAEAVAKSYPDFFEDFHHLTSPQKNETR